MYKTLGADTVGMSSAVEAVAARHMNMKIYDINSITNMVAGMEDEELSQELIDQEAEKSAKDFVTLVSKLIELMP